MGDSNLKNGSKVVPYLERSATMVDDPVAREFWEKNPQGIYIPALFGAKGGAGGGIALSFKPEGVSEHGL